MMPVYGVFSIHTLSERYRYKYLNYLLHSICTLAFNNYPQQLFQVTKTGLNRLEKQQKLFKEVCLRNSDKCRFRR